VRPAVLVIGVFAISLLAAQTCQRGQIRINKQTAIQTATRAIHYRPTQTQVRLVRQGIQGRPFWAVSLSIPRRDGQGYIRLTTARVDANTGKLVSLTGDTQGR
jgi:hypothetical protein